MSQKHEDTPSTENQDTKGEGEEASIKPKRKRISVKYNSNDLLDSNKGLDALYDKFCSIDMDNWLGTPDELDKLMKIYSQWMYKLYPGDFNDMCQRFPNFPGNRSIIESYVLNIQGADNIIDYAASTHNSDDEFTNPDTKENDN